MDAIWSLAKEHQLFVVEDAAHAAGTLYRGKHVGAACFPSDAVAFSFYATKNMTTAEGGMIVANREDIASRIRKLTLHGIYKDAWNRYGEGGSWYYEVMENGFKYNLTDIQSAIGIHQLRKLERFVERRTRYAEIYSRAFGDFDELELPEQATNGRHSWHLYVLRLNLDLLTIDRARFISELKSRQIGASVHFIPIFQHPFFKEWASLPRNQLSALQRFVSSTDFSPALSFDDRRAEVQYIASAVREIVMKFRKSPVIPVTTFVPRPRRTSVSVGTMGCVSGRESDMKLRVLTLFVLLTIVGCASLAAQETQKALTPSETVIGANDGITIVALGADDISKTWRVSSTGELTLPMAGKIHAAGMTTAQFEQELTSRLKALHS